MCTVTFIPAGDHVFLTSNRDEKQWRAVATPPEAFRFKSGKIIFPKDGDAGGTWFAVHENGNAVIFLNGGFVRHQPQPPYRKSRGLILLDLLDDGCPKNQFSEIDLKNIEPFTAVIRDSEELFEYTWDGEQKHQKALDCSIPHIWSSTTLYDEAIVSKRRNWFNQWLKNHPAPTQKDILHFHLFTGDGDEENDLLMNRDGKVFTVSITSAALSAEAAIIEYVDVQQSTRTRKNFPFTNARIKA